MLESFKFHLLPDAASEDALKGMAYLVAFIKDSVVAGSTQ